MICIHHSKDMDGYTSGAVVKHRYPEAKLIGWDYKDDIPDFEQFRDEEVIMIDISFPIKKIVELSEIAKKLTIIDHHISFAREFYREILKMDYPDEVIGVQYLIPNSKLHYVYELGKAACEIGWKYLFPDKVVPYAVTLVGRYDTWREKEEDWENETLPFKYYMHGNCNSAETFPTELFKVTPDSKDIRFGIEIGKEIMGYQRRMDEAVARQNSFTAIFHNLRALCLNYYPFSSETLRSVWNPDKHDIMVGFSYAGNGRWSVSLRSVGDKVDCSIIAKARGGGGHKNAAGFEVSSFEKIFE